MQYQNIVIDSLKDAIQEGFVNEEAKSFSDLNKNDWAYLSSSIMTKEFIFKHADKLDWEELVTGDNTFTIEELDKVIQYFDFRTWKEVSYRDDLTVEFMTKYFDKLDFDLVIEKNKLPGKLLYKVLKADKTDTEHILECHPLTPNTIKILDRVGGLSWYDICLKKKLPTNTMEKYKGDIMWGVYCKHQDMTEEQIEKFSDNLDWEIVSEYQNMSKDFIIKHSNKINVEALKNNKKVNMKELEDLGIIMLLQLTQ